MGLVFGQPIPPIVPNADAIETASFLRIVIGVHILIALCEFFTINWFSGIIECLFAGFGLASVRSNLGFRAHWLRCYFWYCLASLIVDLLILILFYAGVYKITPKWREIAFQVVSIFAIVVYTSSFYLGRKLWHQLLEIIRNDIEGAMHMGHQPGAGGVLGVANAYPVQGAHADAYPMPASAEPVSTVGASQAGSAEADIVQAVPVSRPGGGGHQYVTQPYAGAAHRL
eukprot:jgi/Bigna1/86984/estExt_fgenesh1_pg.C_150234